MELVHNLEKTVAGWYKDLPHLPANFRKWLGENIWWLVVIGLVLSIFSVFSIIGLLLLAFGLTGAAISTVPGAYSGYVASSIYSGVWVATLVSLIGVVVSVVLMGMAVSPLKAKQKKGWTLLFVVLLASAAIGVASAVVSFSVFSIVTTALWAAVEAYFLFEIRDEFGKVAHKVPAKAAEAKK